MHRLYYNKTVCFAFDAQSIKKRYICIHINKTNARSCSKLSNG